MSLDQPCGDASGGAHWYQQSDALAIESGETPRNRYAWFVKRHRRPVPLLQPPLKVDVLVA